MGMCPVAQHPPGRGATPRPFIFHLTSNFSQRNSQFGTVVKVYVNADMGWNNGVNFRTSKVTYPQFSANSRPKT